MTDCIFCMIVAGESPSLKVYEDEEFVAFLDIKNPISAGHTLMIPKKHFNSFSDLPDKVAGDLAIKLKDIAQKIAKAVGADAFNIGINNGRNAGQMIEHVHIHIIPRFEKDGLKSWPGKNYEEKVLKVLAEKIKKAL